MQSCRDTFSSRVSFLIYEAQQSLGVSVDERDERNALGIDDALVVHEELHRIVDECERSA